MTSPAPTTRQDRLLTVNIKDQIAVAGGGGVTLTPLFFDRENGVWVIYLRIEPGTSTPTHFHTGPVHFYTTRGRWNYVEYPDDPQTAGSYLYEPGGSVHTLSVPADASEPAEGFVVVNGANVQFSDQGFDGIADAGAVEDGILAAAKAAGLPAPRYIKPGRGAGYSAP